MLIHVRHCFVGSVLNAMLFFRYSLVTSESNRMAVVKEEWKVDLLESCVGHTEQFCVDTLKNVWKVAIESEMSQESDFDLFYTDSYTSGEDDDFGDTGCSSGESTINLAQVKEEISISAYSNHAECLGCKAASSVPRRKRSAKKKLKKKSKDPKQPKELSARAKDLLLLAEKNIKIAEIIPSLERDLFTDFERNLFLKMASGVGGKYDSMILG